MSIDRPDLEAPPAADSLPEQLPWLDPNGLQSTAALIRGARAGSADAFGELVARLSPWLDRLVAKECPRLDHAVGSDDLKQTALRRAVENVEELEGGSGAELREWIRRIVANAVFDLLRRARAQRRDRDRQVSLSGATEALIAAGDSPLTAAMRREHGETLRRAMQRLAAEDAEVLQLYHLEGLSVQDIASRLAIEVEAVKKRLQRARPRLLLALAAETASGEA